MTPTTKKQAPFSKKNLSRVLVLLVIILSLIAGYFEALNNATQKKYDNVEDMYVRVRNQLGRQETQRLIDLSYETP